MRRGWAGGVGEGVSGPTTRHAALTGRSVLGCLMVGCGGGVWLQPATVAVGSQHTTVEKPLTPPRTLHHLTRVLGVPRIEVGELKGDVTRRYNQPTNDALRAELSAFVVSPAAIVRRLFACSPMSSSCQHPLGEGIPDPRPD